MDYKKDFFSPMDVIKKLSSATILGWYIVLNQTWAGMATLLLSTWKTGQLLSFLQARFLLCTVESINSAYPTEMLRCHNEMPYALHRGGDE
jgi:hypothetical protein